MTSQRRACAIPCDTLNKNTQARSGNNAAQHQNQSVFDGEPFGHRTIVRPVPNATVTTSRITQKMTVGRGGGGTGTRGGTRSKSIGIYRTVAPVEEAIRTLPHSVESPSWASGTPPSVMRVVPPRMRFSPWTGHDTRSPRRAARRPLTFMRSEPFRITPP